ncbi:DUF3306 domain-containing protein [Azohydromonas aeria]|uniref:DUF3306 domain-containing protein n=1 Tax=Azohydromonas aeria TaxID=2590212 RepID=UPI0012F7C1F7|nr:DUF3306 domain-containing protein [Azohydromonas aeria]
MAEDGFFSRWSRRKTQVARGVEPAEPAPAVDQSVRPDPSIPQGRVRPEAGSKDESDRLVRRPGDGAAPDPFALRYRSANPPGSDGSAPAGAVHPSIPQGERNTEPPPTLADVAELGRESDYSRFVARDVAPDVKNAALRKLFSDPHFNVMDGLDIYIDDYGKPDPIPPSMLRQLAQSKMLGLFDDEEDKDKKPNDDPAAAAPAATEPADAAAASEPPPGAAADAAAPARPDPAAEPPLLNTTAPDEDADLQLQPHHAAGRPGPGPGPAAG